jgi:hypothetical protein
MNVSEPVSQAMWTAFGTTQLPPFLVIVVYENFIVCSHSLDKPDENAVRGYRFRPLLGVGAGYACMVHVRSHGIDVPFCPLGISESILQKKTLHLLLPIPPKLLHAYWYRPQLAKTFLKTQLGLLWQPTPFFRNSPFLPLWRLLSAARECGTLNDDMFTLFKVPPCKNAAAAPFKRIPDVDANQHVIMVIRRKNRLPLHWSWSRRSCFERV